MSKRGKRNHFVMFQTCTNAVWSDAFQQWISLEPRGNSSDPQYNMYHCETHYNPAIVYRMRFIENDRIFLVTTVENVDENSREMVIEATEFLPSTP